MSLRQKGCAYLTHPFFVSMQIFFTNLFAYIIIYYYICISEKDNTITN